MNKRLLVITLTSLASLVGCGGGGGGGSGTSSGFYGGTWAISLTRAVNDCGIAAAPTLNVSVVVNQDGPEVVLDSGSRVFTGITNDNDGFIVTDTIPGTRGCVTQAGYSFSNASDGEATVGLALITRCGRGECLLGYSGVASRTSAAPAVLRRSERTPLEHLSDLLASQAQSEPAPTSTMPGMDVEELAEMMTP